ncbi:MAG: hypothetical protein ACREVI_04290 [Steroidobacteraceae bacterium]
MGFNISSWLFRRKIDAHMRMSGRPMEHSRVVNPYHAVSIEPGAKACREARAIDGRRFLASAAPKIPLEDCSNPACKCRYVHYQDRRSMRDRRVLPHNPHAHKMSERRAGLGRRMTD